MPSPSPGRLHHMRVLSRSARGEEPHTRRHQQSTQSSGRGLMLVQRPSQGGAARVQASACPDHSQGSLHSPCRLHSPCDQVAWQSLGTGHCKVMNKQLSDEQKLEQCLDPKLLDLRPIYLSIQPSIYLSRPAPPPARARTHEVPTPATAKNHKSKQNRKIENPMFQTNFLEP